jgi:hypothetical protein
MQPSYVVRDGQHHRSLKISAKADRIMRLLEETVCSKRTLERNKMLIELLLGSVNQDQCAPPGEEVFYGWMHGPASGSDGDEESIAKTRGNAAEAYRLPRLSLRKERWGAILIYGPTQSVYQTDDEAFLLLSRLRFGESIEQIKNDPRNFTQDEIATFAKLLDLLKIS